MLFLLTYLVSEQPSGVCLRSLLLANKRITGGVFEPTKKKEAGSLNSTHSSLPRTVVSQQHPHTVASPLNFVTMCERSAHVAKSRPIVHCARISVSREGRKDASINFFSCSCCCCCCGWRGYGTKPSHMARQNKAKQTAASRLAPQGKLRLRVYVARPAWASIDL